MLAFTSLVSPVSAADDDTVEQAQAAVNAALSPDGQHILIAALVLAALFIAMERFCCWRLGVCLRHDAADRPERRPLVDSVPAMSDTALSRSING